ncbi:MAG: inositol 2-dehydrogenase [Candidatus Parvarchaeota archaeon]|nr:inositol 2-dehydrogenase [Candidatus Jingweiarchaeum tengchongense]
MKKIKIGIIGLGRMGIIHTQNLLKIKEVEVKSIADPRINDVKKWANDFGITDVREDWHSIVDDPDISAVVVTAPTKFHFEIIKTAAIKEKHIFTEKPLSLDLKSAKELLHFLENKNVKVEVGFNRRFDHNYRKVRDVIASGKIGEIHIIRTTTRDPELPDIEFVKNSGGIFFDFFVHDFDYVRFVTNSEVEEVYAGGNVLWDSKVRDAGDYDTAFVTLKMKSGALGVIDASRKAVYGYDQRVEILGSKGNVLSLNDRETNIEIRTKDGITTDKPLQDFQHRYINSYAEELYDFVRCIIDDKMPAAKPKDGYEAILIAEAATISAKENKPIIVDSLR